MGKSFMHRSGLALLMATFSSTAVAQVYLGAALGRTVYKDAEYFGVDDESTTFEAKVGFRAHEVLAFEMSYLNLGDVADFSLGSDVDVNVSGMTLSGKAILPLSPQVDLYAKMGIYFWETHEIYRNRSYYLDEGEDLIYGGGLAFRLTDTVDLNVEYRAVDLYDMGTALTTVGLSFVF